ncbi:hypothetical protein [Chryseolinea sp. H1M3-3]|uniref:hypothetical protein n=1 Tax=Chryseolinea sp. H1M3-3 TaxID=3034144 RepID=UPI0023EBACD0|nr:hypothetical protein [Chryseolinea sp. H1M3-3]
MKRVGQFILIIIISISVLAVAVIVQTVDPAQKDTNVSTYVFRDTLANHIYNLDSLKAIIGENKGLPEGFEVAAAIAYSAYPELKDVKIDMILTQEGAPMESTVNVWTLLGPRTGRHYLILLNDAQGSYFNPILLRSLPFDAQVGILAHELGHVVYYHQLNLLAFGKWGLSYLRDDEFRAIHERTTDLMPVYHGLGSQIYQYAYFVRNDPSCKEFYQQGKNFMDKYYLTDKELLAEIKNEISD